MAHELTFHFDSTDTKVFDRLTAEKRIVCHALVDRLPDKGLEEVLESLIVAYQFYSIPPPSASRITAKPVMARRGRTLARPSFTIEADEL